MTTPIKTAADIGPWRTRLSWTQARAAAELRIHLASYKRIEGGRGEASGTLLRLAELLELHHAAASVAPESVPASSQVVPTASVAASTVNVRTRTGLSTPFGRLRRPALKPAPAAPVAVDTPAPTPATPKMSDSDLALEDALERCCVTAAGRPLILAEIERQRLSRYGSRIEGGPTSRDLDDEAEGREAEWRAVHGGGYPLEVVARLVAEMAGLG
ncbi:MAG: hypothetical protein ACRYGR_01890 [Janthinobacterium lividum]